eukprot:TRINITY_DN16012_c0_g1_i1.p4 TRINITY_DN16012_c0_g1~~TRINITY_DN16012_c0_g1_i1.p4  ORF type:complete len:113 (+),score=25.32 TRINITY_DN16012_c0_g1_i1:145-483(+)
MAEQRTAGGEQGRHRVEELGDEVPLVLLCVRSQRSAVLQAQSTEPPEADAATLEDGDVEGAVLGGALPYGDAPAQARRDEVPGATHRCERQVPGWAEAEEEPPEQILGKHEA